MIITDYCEHCGAKFQIDNTTISECEKKNKWNCHCPGCHTYIDVKKYEFMFTESKTDDSAVLKEEKEKTVAVGKGLPQVFKLIYQILLYSSLIAMGVGILFLIIDVMDKIFTSFGITALYVSIGLATTAIPVYITYWFMENFVRLVEKR